MSAIEGEHWGKIDGKEVTRYTLSNTNGLIMKVTNYGAIITELHTPDRNGNLADITLGFDTLAGYLADTPYFGCIAGRCANRIKKGHFELEGDQYQLALNNPPNSIHGGNKGFDKYVWDAKPLETPLGPALALQRTSRDGEENYPGNLSVSVVYTLTDHDELITEISAETDKSTICNLAQHTYWNLAGHQSGSVNDHVVQIYADHYTPVNAELIPTGQFAPIVGTPLDFIQPKSIGQDLQAVGGDPVGFDHNFVVKGDPTMMRPVACVSEPASGRRMVLSANQPGVQFYVGCFLDGSHVGKGGAVYEQYAGLCLETQAYPDAIHNPSWPQAILKPGEVYQHHMLTKFSAE